MNFNTKDKQTHQATRILCLFVQPLDFLNSIVASFALCSSECQNYQSLTSADRKVNYTYHNISCDSGLGPGWFRFQGAAGTRMPTSCPPSWRCNAHGSGWLNGGHPTVAEGRVTKQVCFHWNSDCCHWTTNIQVINCGSFYVYYFSGTGGWCHGRYCGTD